MSQQIIKVIHVSRDDGRGLENVSASRTGLDNSVVVNVIISAIDNSILFSLS
jgi:hypothetical protein